MSSFANAFISLAALADSLKRLPAMQAKMDIQHAYRTQPQSCGLQDDLSRFYALPGDDCAAISIDSGYQLLAMEGMLPQFVSNAPWFAGWSAVMANISDIVAMGGWPSAIVNAYWHQDSKQAEALLQGIQAACHAYGVAYAGGHTSMAAQHSPALAVAIMGSAKRLLSNLHVRPGQSILMAVNLQGQWHGSTAYWKCFEQVAGEQLQAQLRIIPTLAEQGKIVAARDISNAGILGTLLMLLEATHMGASIDLKQLPIPPQADLLRWLQCFPSYGFLFTAAPEHAGEVCDSFATQGISCHQIGTTHIRPIVDVFYDSQHVEFWNFEQRAFTGIQHVQFTRQE